MADSEKIVQLKTQLQTHVTGDPEGSVIWGVSLVPLFTEGAAPEEVKKAEMVLEKYLVASEQSVEAALARVLKTIQWRKDFKLEEALTQEFGKDFDAAGFIHSVDMERRPIMYNVYGIHPEIFNGETAAFLVPGEACFSYLCHLPSENWGGAG